MYNLHWWPYIGFRVSLGNVKYGFYTEHTRRENPQDRPVESTSDLYYARPALPETTLSDSLAHMYLSVYNYWDSSSDKLGKGLIVPFTTFY